MKETIVDVEFEEITEESENVDETNEDVEDTEVIEEDLESRKEDPEESEEEREVQETINVTFDDIPLNTELNNLGIVGLSCVLILFLLGTLVVMRGD
ncbi:MAG: hypothetical protein J6S67_20055 [Methanobrevibacter sp.]|nr:hypothetical protein [Methanobrevibacter sp.]